MTGAARRAELAGAWFQALDAAGLRWAAVGDDAGFAYGQANDLDIIVAPAALPRLPGLVRRFARAHGLALVQDIQHEACARFFVLAWTGGDGRPEFLYLDCAGDWLRGGRRLLSARRLLRRRERAAAGGLSWWRPAPADNLLYYLLKKVDKGALSAAQGGCLAREWRRDPAGAWRALRRWFPRAWARRLAAACAIDRWESVQAGLPALAAGLRASPRRGSRRLVAEALRAVLRFCRPTGAAVQAPAAEAAAVVADWARAFRRAELRVVRRPTSLRERLSLRLRLAASTLVVVAGGERLPGTFAIGGPRRNQALLAALARRQARTRRACWIGVLP